MFSSRIPDTLEPNRVARAAAEARARGQEVIDLTESNPTRAGISYPADLLAPLGALAGREYRPSALGLTEAREAVAADYRRRGVAVPAAHIALTASTSEAYSLLFKVLCDAGDEVLVPQPSYPLFEHLSRLDAVTAVPYRLEYDGTWYIDVASVQSAITSRTKAMLLVHPNNPTGSYVKAAEFDALASVCRAGGLAIVADEVFADYELVDGARRAAASVLAESGCLTFSLGGLSKTVGLPQVKLGWIAVGGLDRAVPDALERLEFACDTYLSVSTPVQLAAAALLSHGATVRDQIHARVRANLRHAHAAAAAAPSCRVLRAEGGWYAVLQVPSYQSEEELVLQLLKEGVLAHPGYYFDFPRESFLVLSLLVPEPLFTAGLSRITRHFTCSERATT